MSGPIDRTYMAPRSEIENLVSNRGLTAAFQQLQGDLKLSKQRRVGTGAGVVKPQKKLTITEQKDAQAWQEIQRQRDQGRSDGKIWFNAVRAGDLEVVGAFIRNPPQGFDVNQQSDVGYTALEVGIFAEDNSFEMVQLLVEEGRVDLTAQKDGTHSAYEQVQSIYDQKRNGTSVSGVPEEQTLEKASGYLKERLNEQAEVALANGDVEKVDRLVEAGADPIDAERLAEKRNEKWFEAVEEGDYETMRAFIENPPEGWDVNVKAADGSTALEWAVRYGSADLVKVLVSEGGADILGQDAMGRTSLGLAEELKEGSGASLYDAKIEFLKDELDLQAKTAFEGGNVEGYQRLLDAGAEPPLGAPSEMVEEFDIEAVDVNSMTFKDEDGKEITVNEATIRSLMEDYAKGIKDGNIKKGDARHTFFYSMQAQNDVQNGAEIYPYYESPIAGGTERMQGDPITTTPEDMADFYNADSVSKALTAAQQDEQIMSDWAEAQQEAIGKLDRDPEVLKTEIEETARSEEFKNYLATLGMKGESEEAQARVQQLLASYAAVASEEEVNTLTQSLAMDDIGAQLDHIMSDPDNIEDQYWEKAVTDWAATTLEALNRGVQLGRHGLKTVELNETEKYLKRLANGTSRDLQLFAQAFKEFAKISGDGKMGMSSIPSTSYRINEKFDQKLKEIMDKNKVPFGQRNDFIKFFTNLNNAGAFTTAIGTLALAGGIYQLTKGEHGTGNHEQNLTIARSFLLFFGTTPEGAKWLTGSALGKYMGMGDTAAIFGAKSIQDIFKVDSKTVQQYEMRSPPGTSVTFDLETSKRNEGPLKWVSDKIDGGVPNQLKTKIAAGAIKVMGSTSFTGFGIADLALGGVTIDKGVKSGDDITIAQGSMQILTGAFTTAAGAGMVGQAFGAAAKRPWIGAMISPLLASAAIIGLVIVGIDIIRGIVNAFKNDDIASEKKLEYFETMGELGLLKDGWREKYEFLVKSFYGNGGTDSTRPHTEEGQSVFDAFDWEAWLKDHGEKENDFGTTDRARSDETYEEYIERLDKADNPDSRFEYDYGIPAEPPDHRTAPDQTTDQDYENSLNGAVTIYHDRINLSERKVPEESGELEGHLKGMMSYYFEHVNTNGTPETAAAWVKTEIEGRLPGAYPDGEGNTEVDENDDGAMALDIYDGRYDDQGGREILIDMAKGVLEEDYRS